MFLSNMAQIPLKFDKRSGSRALETHVEFKNDGKTSNTDLRPWTPLDTLR